MATYVAAARTADGNLMKQGTSYALAQSATPSVSNTSSNAAIGQQKAGVSDFRIYRAYLSFDTSAIPEGAIIDSAVLNYYFISDSSTDADFNIHLYYATQPTFGGALNSADWGSGNIGPTLVCNTAGVSIATLYSANLPTASINIGGITEYELRSDREGTEPAGNEYVGLSTANNATYKPSLSVTYTLPNDDSMDQDGALIVLSII